MAEQRAIMFWLPNCVPRLLKNRLANVNICYCSNHDPKCPFLAGNDGPVACGWSSVVFVANKLDLSCRSVGELSGSHKSLRKWLDLDRLDSFTIFIAVFLYRKNIPRKVKWSEIVVQMPRIININDKSVTNLKQRDCFTFSFVPNYFILVLDLLFFTQLMIWLIIKVNRWLMNCTDQSVLIEGDTFIGLI